MKKTYALFIFIICQATFSFADHRFLLITGCARSGTTYMSNFLKASGLDTPHEHVGNAGSVSWLMNAKCDWAPWGQLAQDYTFEHIFHQVRDPLKMIQSFYNSPPLATWEWIQLTIPEILPEDKLITKCAKYWYYWNIKAEAKAEWTYTIENFETLYKEMGERLGFIFSAEILKTIPKNTNTRGTPKFIITWKLLEQELEKDLYCKLRLLAIHYGYSVE